MSSTQPLLIEVYDGDKLLAKQVMHQTKVIIGRILSADFRIQDQRVSRIHALLEWMDDGKLRLTDLASTHGTFVNGERIVEKFISLSDDIAFATLKAKIKVADGDATLAPTRTPTEAKARPPQAAAPRAPSYQAPSAPQVHAGGGVEAVPSGVTQPREATVIRSLKETARTRGVLDPAASSTEELEVTVYWENTILHVDHYRQGKHTIKLGEKVDSTYIVPMNGIPEGYEFVKVQGQTADLFLHASMKGSVRTQGKIFSVEDLMKSGRSQVTLGGQDIAKIRVGNVNFFMMFVPRPPSITKAPLFDQGPIFWTAQLSLAGLAALFLSFGFSFQKPIEGEVKEFPEKYKKILIEEYKRRVEFVPPPVVQAEVKSNTPEPPKTPPKTGKTEKEAVHLKDAVMTDKVARQGGNEGEGARERGAEGKRGWQNSPHETGITNRPKPKNATARVPVRDAPVKGSNEGILSALKNSGIGTQLAKVSGAGTGAGGGGGAQGNDPLDKALLGVGGGGIRSGRGSGGSGLQGSGTGGGGTAVGVGGLGSKGFGGGATGDGVGSLPGKGDFAVTTETVGVTVLGGLSREEIARVVNAHQSEINLCYQRELQRDPRLFGKISLKWLIGSGGRVGNVSVAENATGSSALASCIASKVKSWQFPVPPEGSEANVEWPWIFKPQGT